MLPLQLLADKEPVGVPLYEIKTLLNPTVVQSRLTAISRGTLIEEAGFTVLRSALNKL